MKWLWRIQVEEVGDFAAGDWVVLRADATESLIQDLHMQRLWGSPEVRARLGGPLFYR